MTSDQYLLFGILICLFALLIWGRIRYDIVALGALVVAVVLGVVDQKSAFEGFGHPATIIIALVLVVSRGLANSGAVDILARLFTGIGKTVSSHITVMASLGAAMSALMNNVGALALLMPVDINAAEKAKRSPAITLMPLSFATILGGLVTLIGTPPNIIISSIREKELGAPFKMFDYAPVGLACAVAGVAFVALVGWRLLPKSTREREAGKELFELGSYLVELTIGPESKSIGRSQNDVEAKLNEHDVVLVALIRNGQELPSYAGWMKMREGDVLLVETVAENIDSFVKDMELSFGDAAGRQQVTADAPAMAMAANKSDGPTGDTAEAEPAQLTRPNELQLIEVVVRPGGMIEGRTAAGVKLHELFGCWLIGISREGRKVTRQVRHMALRPGDVLLLLGEEERMQAATEWMGALPLAERGLQVRDGRQAMLAAALFGAAILAASVGWLYLPVALAGVTVLYVLTNIVPMRQLYDAIEWPVVVLIGSLIPIGAALEQSGGTQLLAQWIVDVSQGAPPWVVLTLLMIVTMTLSDVLNNTATALIAAPVAIGVAKSLGVNPDPFLMAVAIAASCAFLTPIGHKNNTLIMGPGGYRFGDYWRMGLPLEILVVAVSVPLILVVWPF